MLYSHVANNVRPMVVMLLLEYTKAKVDEKKALIISLNALATTITRMVEKIETQDPDTVNGSNHFIALFEIVVTMLELFGDNDTMTGMNQAQNEQALIELYNKGANKELTHA